MIHWFAHLSWSEALLIVMSVLALWSAAFLVAAQCFGFNDRPVPPRRKTMATRRASDPWFVRDYSEKRQRALDQLGDDWLLAKPVNRRAESNVVSLTRRQAE